MRYEQFVSNVILRKIESEELFNIMPTWVYLSLNKQDNRALTNL